MRNRFDRELAQLNESLVEMGTLNEKALERIIHVFSDDPPPDLQLLRREVREYEQRADRLEGQIQAQSMALLISQQPVARDLRTISTALNIITDMERIADQVCDVAELALLLKTVGEIKNNLPIVEMIRKCIIMVHKGVDAFVAQDVGTARMVILSDDEVDRLFLHTRDELIHVIGRDPKLGPQAVDLIMIAKYFERIADHAVNIAEWVIFSVTGEHKNVQLL